MNILEVIKEALNEAVEENYIEKEVLREKIDNKIKRCKHGNREDCILCEELILLKEELRI